MLRTGLSRLTPFVSGVLSYRISRTLYISLEYTPPRLLQHHYALEPPSWRTKKSSSVSGPDAPPKIYTQLPMAALACPNLATGSSPQASHTVQTFFSAASEMHPCGKTKIKMKHLVHALNAILADAAGYDEPVTNGCN